MLDPPLVYIMLVLRGVSSVFEIAFCIIMFEFRAFLRSELGPVNLGLQFGMYIIRIQCIEIHAISTRVTIGRLEVYNYISADFIKCTKGVLF